MWDRTESSSLFPFFPAWPWKTALSGGARGKCLNGNDWGGPCLSRPSRQPQGRPDAGDLLGFEGERRCENTRTGFLTPGCVPEDRPQLGLAGIRLQPMTRSPPSIWTRSTIFRRREGRRRRAECHQHSSEDISTLINKTGCMCYRWVGVAERFGSVFTTKVQEVHGEKRKRSETHGTNW